MKIMNEYWVASIATLRSTDFGSEVHAVDYCNEKSLRLRGLSPEFGLLKENSRKRTKMPTEQEAKPAVVTPSLQQWRSPSTFRGAPGEDPSQMA
ncbi:hypothetical protein TNCV_4399971 [Trichonephila clavipes]|nr:hypothetical protein TNCV_4399971 [Trichonephila clavipes]